jgi:hypothetical protein
LRRSIMLCQVCQRSLNGLLHVFIVAGIDISLCK